MDKSKFDEIIDFAIQGEKSAVKFYHDLQTLVTFKAKKELLREYEEIEKGHVEVLEKLRQNVFETGEIKVPEVTSLKISDYLLEVEPSADMSYQDIIITAMKKEEQAQKLYTDLASQSEDERAKQVFLRLAAEEAKHKVYFEKVYDDEILTDN
jgi:rubrerythrin